ncbi:response regulator [Legionella israelensis]|uniref:DNA-binding response regulator n=1 Tax=Legionella israelensis TaxID=454 RepID=A0A0W0VI17_9GAMM|nr:response regulator [Legionella israelensis]KTD19494.1 DNA-binding response regulator [Legionella israelensis]QBS08662.1 response regulator [Legionella israelensis]QDP72504.1 response regulator [Legionella israelensis]SCY46104.1 two-component system, OmpR family, response regulator [Legionella israelensis DSM 19235]STX58326.1 DNA-binding response regulator in two-component regulatory system with QseC [Legionella israelensis]
MRLLLVEDDELLGDAVKTGLTQFGYVVDWLKDGEAARAALKTETFELIILDLGLPKLSGLNLLQHIRQEGNSTPVIILTARESVEDRVKGLDSGADDYLIKPFDLNELSARIRALVRRSQGRADALIHYRNITLDPAAHSVMVDNELVNVPRREFALLQKLLENSGQVLSREQLMQSIYGWDEDVDSNALEVHIHNLRKKLNANFIRTIRGVGYMIEKSEGAPLT